MKRSKDKRVVKIVAFVLDAQNELSKVAAEAMRCAGFGEKAPTKRLILAAIKAHIAYVRYNRLKKEDTND